MEIPARIRKSIRIAAVLVTAIMASGCSLLGGGPPQGLLDWKGMNSEHQAAVDTFPYALPDGVSFPTDAPGESYFGGSSLFEPSIGEAKTYEFAACSYDAITVAREGTNFDAAMQALDRAEEIRGAALGRRIR